MQSSESTITAVEAGKRHDPQMLGVGATLQNGKYTIEAQLSHGGFGMTYKVLDRDRNKHFALKELFLKGINERCSDRTTISLVPTSDTEQFNQNRDLFESQVRSFKREGDRMIDLQHPNIVRVYTIFEENDTVYYVMDYIDGESLDARLKHLGRPLSEDEVMQLLPQVLSALEYTHQHNIRHLDIKPANIMVGKDGHAVLIDFGASKQVKATDQMTSTLSSMALTRGYAPMEQVEQNTRQIGPWTDFYALGATLYKLLTNIETLPTASEIMGGYEFQYPDSVSRKMRDLISWLMQPACVKRPQSVAEIREFLGNKVQAGNKADKENLIGQRPQQQIKNDDDTHVSDFPRPPKRNDDEVTITERTSRIITNDAQPKVDKPLASPSQRSSESDLKVAFRGTLWLILGIVISIVGAKRFLVYNFEYHVAFSSFAYVCIPFLLIVYYWRKLPLKSVLGLLLFVAFAPICHYMNHFVGFYSIWALSLIVYYTFAFYLFVSPLRIGSALKWMICLSALMHRLYSDFVLNELFYKRLLNGEWNPSEERLIEIYEVTHVYVRVVYLLCFLMLIYLVYKYEKQKVQSGQ